MAGPIRLRHSPSAVTQLATPRNFGLRAALAAACIALLLSGCGTSDRVPSSSSPEETRRGQTEAIQPKAAQPPSLSESENTHRSSAASRSPKEQGADAHVAPSDGPSRPAKSRSSRSPSPPRQSAVTKGESNVSPEGDGAPAPATGPQGTGSEVVVPSVSPKAPPPSNSQAAD